MFKHLDSRRLRMHARGGRSIVNRSSLMRRSKDLIRASRMTRVVKAVGIVNPSLQKGTNKICEESDESKRLERLLQAALVDQRRRVNRTTAIVVVVLRREDERREPEVREDPGERGEVAFVGFEEGQGDGGEVEECVDGGLGEC